MSIVVRHSIAVSLLAIVASASASISASAEPNLPDLFTTAPPAYDPNGSGRGVRDGTFSTSFLGVSEGLNVFSGVNPGADTYTLNVTVPTGPPTTLTATTTLAAPVLLPTATAPTVTFNADGSFNVAYVLPAGSRARTVQTLNIGGGTCGHRR